MTEPTPPAWSGSDPQPGPDRATSTGDPVVDDAITRLDELDVLDLPRHPQAYEAIHDALRAALDGAHQPDQSRS